MKISVMYDYEDVKKSEYLDNIKKYKKNIKACIKECLKEENIQTNIIEVYIKYTTNENMHKINKQYRTIDKTTDVLSFPMYEQAELIQDIKKYNIQDMPVPLGDIVISIEKVEEQSKEYNHSFQRELIYLIVHSMFHLLGYDHMNDKQKKIMRVKEEKIMSLLNIDR